MKMAIKSIFKLLITCKNLLQHILQMNPEF
jgi:hypothetical protein